MGLLRNKQCTKCWSWKKATAEFFPLHNRTQDGFDSWCRSCRSAYRSETRRGRYRCMASDEQIKELLADATCTICGETNRLAVDHCHESNAIRGILCMECNLGIGKFKDSPELLEFARIYLLSSKNDPEADEYLEKYL